MCKNCRESFETISYHFNQKLFKYIDTDSSVCQGGALLCLCQVNIGTFSLRNVKLYFVEVAASSAASGLVLLGALLAVGTTSVKDATHRIRLRP